MNKYESNKNCRSKKAANKKRMFNQSLTCHQIFYYPMVVNRSKLQWILNEFRTVEKCDFDRQFRFDSY